MLCKNCNKKNECKAICPDLEEELRDRNFERAQIVEIPYSHEAIDYIQNKNRNLNSFIKYKGKDISIDKMLSVCTEKQRECISRYYGLYNIKAIKQQEIADTLGIHVSVVCKHIQRGLKRIRKKFKIA